MLTAKRVWRSNGKSPRHIHAKTTMLRAAAVFYRFSEASALSIDAVTSGESGVTAGSKRARICPSGPTRNFLKFHLISPPVFRFAHFSLTYIYHLPLLPPFPP